MSKELKTYKEKVYEILKESEKARNNDGTMIAHYLNRYCPRFVSKDQDGELVIRLKDFQHLPPLENLRRSRQIIQNDDGAWIPTDPAVIKARKIKEKNWRDAEVREAKNITPQYKD